MEWAFDFKAWSVFYAAGVVPLWFTLRWVWRKVTKSNLNTKNKEIDKIKEEFKSLSESTEINNSLENIYKNIERLEDERKEMREDIRSLAQEINLSTTKLEGHMNELMMTMVKLNLGDNS